MRHAAHVAFSVAVWPLIVIFSPVILVVGEPVNRYAMRRVRSTAATVPPAGDWPVRATAVLVPTRASLLLEIVSNPLWIALTAPGRWVGDRLRRGVARPLCALVLTLSG